MLHEACWSLLHYFPLPALALSLCISPDIGSVRTLYVVTTQGHKEGRDSPAPSADDPKWRVPLLSLPSHTQLLHSHTHVSDIRHRPSLSRNTNTRTKPGRTPPDTIQPVTGDF